MLVRNEKDPYLRRYVNDVRKYGTVNKIEASGTLGKKLVLMIGTNFFYSEGPWGLNFDLINLKFSQNLGHIVVYNLWKFQIDIIKIEV